MIRPLAAIALALVAAACSIGIGVTNAPTIPECVPGSVSKPCPRAG